MLSVLARQWVADNEETVEAMAGNADSLSFWYMGDGHWFARLTGSTLDEIIQQAEEIRAEEGSRGYYGMLCPVTLLRNGKEVARVGKGAHCSGKNKEAEWKGAVAAWRHSLESDARVMDLLRQGKVEK